MNCHIPTARARDTAVLEKPLSIKSRANVGKLSVVDALAELGDPYTRTGADINGRVGIDWGVYGVPETFIIDREGRIAHKHIGPVTREALRDKIIPLINELRGNRGAFR